MLSSVASRRYSSAVLGLPRIGPQRELKTAVESYWKGKISEEDLDQTCRTLREGNWRLLASQGIDFIPSNDFSLYDHVLDTSAMLGAIPDRFRAMGGSDLNVLFRMARGQTQGDVGTEGVDALEMTKWFNTNYHFMVPELSEGQRFSLNPRKILTELEESKRLGIATRPVLVGPLTWLLLAKGSNGFDTLTVLENIVDLYIEIMNRISSAGASALQIDEPVLTLELQDRAKAAYVSTYRRLGAHAQSLGLRLTVATYFQGVEHNLDTVVQLHVDELHVDCTVMSDDALSLLAQALSQQSRITSVSLGVIDGRNVWRSNLDEIRSRVIMFGNGLASNISVTIATSCSLLHVPVDLALEDSIPQDLMQWLAFAAQKIDELSILTNSLNGDVSAMSKIQESALVAASRRVSNVLHVPSVKQSVADITPEMYARPTPFTQRKALQMESLKLPILPTTTIGSFPQTPDIRRMRALYKKGRVSEEEYEAHISNEIRVCIAEQEQLDIDVLVHGEAERSDMVDYFAEQLGGCLTTSNGWVQSFGSRCVKPPIIYGDVSRPQPMTVKWATYAQSLTDRPVKGMLTGPVTLLQWSFVRDDQPREITCKQLALAVREEVRDLEAAGIKVIQVDEPAFREGLPLLRPAQAGYLRWAVDSFLLATCVVAPTTQIHTHMCYCEFGEVINSIADMDADCISIETARSGMELLGAFQQAVYTNDIGFGIFDIHTPRIPLASTLQARLERFMTTVSPSQVWVNPDCGLKTRTWAEARPALRAMVDATKAVRASLTPQA